MKGFAVQLAQENVDFVSGFTVLGGSWPLGKPWKNRLGKSIENVILMACMGPSHHFIFCTFRCFREARFDVIKLLNSGKRIYYWFLQYFVALSAWCCCQKYAVVTWLWWPAWARSRISQEEHKMLQNVLRCNMLLLYCFLHCLVAFRLSRSGLERASLPACVGPIHHFVCRF